MQLPKGEIQLSQWFLILIIQIGLRPYFGPSCFESEKEHHVQNDLFFYRLQNAKIFSRSEDMTESIMNTLAMKKSVHIEDLKAVDFTSASCDDFKEEELALHIRAAAKTLMTPDEGLRLFEKSTLLRIHLHTVRFCALSICAFYPSP